MTTDVLAPLAIVEAPHYVHNPGGSTPLSGELAFSTSTPAVASIVISDGDREWTVPAPGPATSEHRIAILGMRPGRDHQIHIAAVGLDGSTADWQTALTVSTPELPADLPALVTRIAKPERMEPGVSIFGIRKSAQQGDAKSYGYIVAVDEVGEVVWLRHCGHTVGDIKRLANGNILYLTFDNRAIEIDMLGRVQTQWAATRRWPDAHAGEDFVPVDTDAFHHEILELPNGNLVTLGISVKSLDRYPTSETDPAAPKETADVVGDEVVEFTRDGTVVGRWSLFDLLDPYRIGHMSLSGYWAAKGLPGSKDWTHANAADYDPSDDSFIVSVRHLDAVIKFSRATGELAWILGNHAGWNAPEKEHLLAPKGEFEWQYHQHNTNLTERGTVLMFDNGNFRVPAFETPVAPPDSYSRAVEFEVDEQGRSVRQLWEFKGEYAAYISGVRQLPETGNMFINFGGILTDEQGSPSQFPPTDMARVRMVEVTYDADAEIVFELTIDERGDNKGWDVYRAERFAGLYPPSPG
ncbi:MAG: aryl-sulfate sulfotransferase [Alphaproteobacteria bacterium]|nr:aryl-sulfate sulfotransferase [Alphaproteobacteria bacterium]